MRNGRRIAGLALIIGLALVAVPQAGYTIGGPGHIASGTGTLPDSSTLGINAGDVAGGGGLGLATLTPVTGGPIRIALTCVVISIPATNLTTGHTLKASGIGTDLLSYQITITDSGMTGVPDTAGISATAGSPCVGTATANLAGDPYLILL